MYKNIILKTKYVLLVLIMALAFSCSPEDGADGINGIDGVDSNVNVTTYFFNEPQWGSNGFMRLDMTNILTTEVVTNDVILVYVRSNFTNSERVFQIPGWVHGQYPDFQTQMITPYFTDSVGGAGAFQNPESVYISSRTIDNVTVQTAKLIPLSWIKVIIIESANTINGISNKDISPKDNILNELKISGINVNDYHAVCEYYGITSYMIQ